MLHCPRSVARLRATRFPRRTSPRMSFTVTIRPSGHRFSVESDETVLTAALREGFNLAYGCRNGACGSCKGRLLGGRIDYGDYQESALSEIERASGLALFCCAKPQ